MALALGLECNLVRGAGTNDLPRVGPLREFDRFTFDGATTFPAWSLWLALNSTLDFPELSHPLAPRANFLAAIESHLRLGYEHCGFPDARVAARYDAKADRVIVQIKEGARYRCGPVEVIGAQKMPTQPIVKALTETNANTSALPQPFLFLDNAPANRNEVMETNNVNAWAEGLPAHFDEISLRSLSSRVTNTLAKHGFFLSRFSLNVVTNAITRTATLQVKITEEGPSATIGSIAVVGNRKNSREALLNYLGLKPGMKFTSDLAATLNDRLYHSARFLTNSVIAGTPDSSGRMKLTLEVLESDYGPLLTTQFEPVEKTMLKARDWIANLGNTRDEIVITASGYSDEPLTLQFILAPQQGSLILENEAVSGTNRLRHALIMSTNQFALYVPRLRQKFLTDFSTEQFKSYIIVETSAPGADGNTGNFTAGAGLQSLNEATNMPPYALSMSLAPAAFLHLAHSTHYAIWFAGNQLICSNASFVLKLDAQTGKFSGLTAKGGEPRQTHMNLSLEPDAFESALAKIERDGAGFTNVCLTNAPVSSGIAFFGSELVQLPIVNSFLQTQLPATTCAQLPALLRQLGNEEFLSPFEIFKDPQGATNDPTEDFEIPQEPEPQLGGGGLVQTELAAMSQAVLTRSDLIFPPRSWPWTILRDFAFILQGHPTYLTPDMAGIYAAAETGPIGYLAGARIAKGFGSTAKNMANLGLAQLSTEAFRRDCRVLLDEHYLAGRFAARLAASLGDLDEAQLDALVVPLNQPQAEFVRNCAKSVRTAQKGQPLVETIAPALNAYWEKDLKQSVAVQLKKIAEE